MQGNFANIVREYYDWDKIAEQTAFVYKDLVSVPQTAQEDSVRAESSNLQDERLQMAS